MKTGLNLSWHSIIVSLAFSLLLTACGGGSDDPEPPPPTPDPTPTPENKAPTVSIAELAEAKEQEAFTLIATATDSDGEISKYEWSANPASGLTLTGADTSELTVTSPDISDDLTVTFTLKVTDNGSEAKTAEASQTVIIKRKVSSVTITGIVTDKPIANANVTLSAGGSSIQVQAGADGSYSGELVVDESEVKDLVQIKAQGTGDQSNVEFWSLLNSVETVITQAGDDGVLQKEENFSVNVTNVTTAEYAIITRDGEAPKDDEALKSALLNVDADEKLQLATLIKIVVDNPEFQLPEGVNNTLELIASTETAQAFEAEVNEKDPTLIENTKTEIKEDTDLVTGPTGTLVGDYILQSPRYYNNLAYHLNLKDDNTGVINGIDQQTVSSWVLDGNKLSLTLAAPLTKSMTENILEDQTRQRVETFVSSMSMVVLGENEVFRTVEVTEETYQALDGVAQDPETVTYISNLTSKSQTALPTSEMLTADGGIWYLDLHDRDYTSNDDPEEQVDKLIFNADGTIATESANEEVTWRIEGRAIVIDYKDYTDETKQEVAFEGSGSIWLTKVLDAGYQVVVLDTSDDEWPNTEYGLMIKPSEVTVNESTMSGRWHGFYGLNQSYYMDLYPDGLIYFGLERSNYLWEIDGNTMVRKTYMQNGVNVEGCNEAREDCYVSVLTEHEMLAMVNDRYYLKRTFKYLGEDNVMRVSESQLFIFEYSNDLSISAFDKVLPNYGDSFIVMQDASGNLQIVVINRDTVGFDGTITFGEQSYNFNFEDGKIAYDMSGTKYLLEIIQSSQDFLDVCLRVSDASCEDSNKGRIWKKLPMYGNTIINNSELYRGETIGLNLGSSFVNGEFVNKGKVKTAQGEYDVSWYPVFEGTEIVVNLNEPGVKFSYTSGTDQVEHKLIGFNIKSNLADVSQVMVTERVDVYTNGEMTGTQNKEFEAIQYYERDFLDLSEVDFVGDWVANTPNEGGETVRLEFNADGTATGISNFDQEGEMGSFNWRVDGKKLVITHDNMEVNTVYMSKDLSVGYQFIDSLDDLDSNWGKITPGLLIKDTAPQLSKEDYLGRWKDFNGVDRVSPVSGTEVYEEPDNDTYLTFVYGTRISSIQGRYENGQVILARYLNPQTNEIVRLCDPNPDTCIKQSELLYQMVAEHEGLYYWASDWIHYDSEGNKNPRSSWMHVSEINKSTDIEKLEDYHVSYFYLYQMVDGNPVAWNSYSSTTEDNQISGSLRVGDAEAIQYTFNEGQIQLVMDGQDTIIELVPGSNNKDGLTLCKYIKGEQCTEQGHIPLFFSPPN